jgi:hypothetical protein
MVAVIVDLVPLHPYNKQNKLRSRKLRLTTVEDPPRWPRDTPISAKVGTKFLREVASLSRYSSLADQRPRSCYNWTRNRVPPAPSSQWSVAIPTELSFFSWITLGTFIVPVEVLGTTFWMLSFKSVTEPGGGGGSWGPESYFLETWFSHSDK